MGREYRKQKFIKVLICFLLLRLIQILDFQETQFIFFQRRYNGMVQTGILFFSKFVNFLAQFR